MLFRSKSSSTHHPKSSSYQFTILHPSQITNLKYKCPKSNKIQHIELDARSNFTRFQMGEYMNITTFIEMYISHPKEKKKYREESERLKQIFNLIFSTYLGRLISQSSEIHPCKTKQASKKERKPKVVLNNFSS